MPRPFRASLLALLLLLSGQPARAYLGGFEDQDGYRDGGSFPMRDVSSYNAGAYGSNNGGPGGGFQNITPNSGLFYKSDGGDISDGYGELVAHYGFGHTGNAGLVLRTSLAFGDTPGDGADYTYSFDSRDFNGTTPGLVTSGVISLDYWSCPQTGFFAQGTVTTTEFLNAAGDTVFAIGTLGQNGFTADPIIQWYDGTGWQTTTIIGNHGGWDHISLAFDLDNDTVSFDYFSSLDNTTYNVASGVSAANAMTSLKGIRFTAAPETIKNAYDDFTINAPAVVPEPGAMLLLIGSAVPCWTLRRRR